MSRNAKLGLFTVAAILVFAFLSYKMGTFEFGRKTYLLEVAFDSVGGLGFGAPVQMAGVNIGVVEGIELRRDSHGQTRAVVTARIDWDARISEEAVASVRMVGFLGDSVLEVSTTPGEPVKRDPRTALHQIEGIPPFEMQRIVARLEEGLDKLTPIMDNASALIGSATSREAFESILVSLKQFSASLSSDDPDQVKRILEKTEIAVARLGDVAAAHVEIASDVRTLVRENRQTVTSSLTELEATLRSFRQHEQETAPNVILAASRAATSMVRMDQTLQRIEQLIARNEANLDRAFDEASTTASLARGAAEDLSVIVGDVRAGKGSLGRLLRDDDLADELSAGIGETRELVRRFQNPLSGLQLQYELRAYEKDETSWSDRDSHLRHDLALRVPFGETWFMTAGANDIGADTGLELMFGGSWKRLTGRFGVLESEAALGADVGLWPERLTLSAEYIGLTDRDREHFDTFLNIHLPLKFDLILGVDDVFDDQYLNAGFRKSF